MVTPCVLLFGGELLRTDWSWAALDERAEPTRPPVWIFATRREADHTRRAYGAPLIWRRMRIVSIEEVAVMVDPKVHALAVLFVDDVINDLPDDHTAAIDRDALITRAAEAMQQAVEDECAAISDELRAS